MHDTIARLWPGIHGSHMMRDGALSKLSDADLAFSPGGGCPSLGELFKALGETQHTYIESFKTLTHDWSFRNDAVGLASSVPGLQQWFGQLDEAFQQIVEGFSDDGVNKVIDRGNGVERTVLQQLEIYNQAQLIFLGKLVVYFQAMDKPLPQSIQHYIV